MTQKEKLNRISKLVDDLDLGDVSRHQLWEEMRGLSLNELEELIWELYCFAKDIQNTIEPQESEG